MIRKTLQILFFSAVIFGCGFMVGGVVMRSPRPGCSMCSSKCNCCNCARKTLVPFLLYNPTAKPSCGCK